MRFSLHTLLPSAEVDTLGSLTHVIHDTTHESFIFFSQFSRPSRSSLVYKQISKLRRVAFFVGFNLWNYCLSLSHYIHERPLNLLHHVLPIIEVIPVFCSLSQKIKREYLCVSFIISFCAVASLEKYCRHGGQNKTCAMRFFLVRLCLRVKNVWFDMYVWVCSLFPSLIFHKWCYVWVQWLCQANF